jgi:hypothetical protein
MSRLKTDAIRNVNASVDGITLDTSGNVAIPNKIGINTTSPEDLLHIKTGKIRIENAIVSNNDSTISYDNDTFLVDVDPNNVRGSSQFQIKIDTVSGLIIDDNRRVGIGTTSPTQKLDVAGSLQLGNGNAIGFGDQSARIIGESGASGILRFDVNGGEKLRITSTGDIGINCTPHSNAGINLQIHGDNTTSEIRLTNTTTGNGNNGGTIQMGGNTFYISNSENGNTVFENNGSERLRITSDGQLIHKTNKASGYIAEFHQLHADNPGTIQINSPTDNNLRPAAVHLAQAGTVKWVAGQVYSSTADRAFHLCAGTGQSNSKVVVTTAGRVGISDTNPQSKLAVSDAGSTADPVIMAHVSGSNGSNLGFGLYSSVNSKYTFKVTNNGRVQVNDGIDFSLTSHASGMTSELLSDYEEGDFTLHFAVEGYSNASMSGRYGFYRKIGDIVHIWGGGTVANTYGSAAYNRAFEFKNLPFTPKDASGASNPGYVTGVFNYSGASSTGISNMSGTAPYSFRPRLFNGNTYGRIEAYRSDSSQGSVNASLAFPANAAVGLYLCYSI